MNYKELVNDVIRILAFNLETFSARAEGGEGETQTAEITLDDEIQKVTRVKMEAKMACVDIVLEQVSQAKVGMAAVVVKYVYFGVKVIMNVDFGVKVIMCVYLGIKSSVYLFWDQGHHVCLF